MSIRGVTIAASRCRLIWPLVLPQVHAIRPWEEASTAPLPVPPPQEARVVIGDIKMRFCGTTVFMFLRRSIAYLIDCSLVFLLVRPAELQSA